QAFKPVTPAAAARTVTWPVRDDNADRAPSDVTLAYATPQAPLGAGSAMRPDPMGDTARTAKPAAASHDNNVTTVAKKTVVRTASLEPASALRTEQAAPAAERVVVPGGSTVTAKTVSANAGMRYDDPWLRAMIVAPNLTDSMTATLYGTP